MPSSRSEQQDQFTAVSQSPNRLKRHTRFISSPIASFQSISHYDGIAMPIHSSTLLRALILVILSRYQRGTLIPSITPQALTLRTLLSLVYRCDFDGYAILGTPLTHSRYTAQPEGPVPNGWYRILRRLVRQRRITLHACPARLAHIGPATLDLKVSPVFHRAARHVRH